MASITIIDRLESSMEHARLRARDLYVLNHEHPLLKLLHYEEHRESGNKTQDNWSELMRLAHDRFPEEELNLLKIQDYIRLWDEISILFMEATVAERVHSEQKRQAEKQKANHGGNQIAA